MNAIPARVAGVPEVVAACAAPGGKVPDVVLAAARITGVSAVYRIGGAQAIAALAYGTRSIPAVDVIAGPGNAYVTEAKRQVFGIVGIDMLAGPSELVVLADGTANASYVAADLLSQAEHDEDAYVALVTDSESLPRKVEREIARQARLLPRKAILAASLPRGDGFLVRTLAGGDRRRQPPGAGAPGRRDPGSLEVLRGDPERRDRVPRALQPGGGGRLHRGDQPHACPREGPPVSPPPWELPISSRKPTWYHMKFPRSDPTAPTWSGWPGRKGSTRTRRRSGCGSRGEGNGDDAGKPDRADDEGNQHKAFSPAPGGRARRRSRRESRSSTTCSPCSPATGCST